MLDILKLLDLDLTQPLKVVHTVRVASHLYIIFSHSLQRLNQCGFRFFPMDIQPITSFYLIVYDFSGVWSLTAHL